MTEEKFFEFMSSLEKKREQEREKDREERDMGSWGQTWGLQFKLFNS